MSREALELLDDEAGATAERVSLEVAITSRVSRTSDEG